MLKLVGVTLTASLLYFLYSLFESVRPGGRRGDCSRGCRLVLVGALPVSCLLGLLWQLIVGVRWLQFVYIVRSMGFDRVLFQ